MRKLQAPSGMAVAARDAAVGRSVEAMAWDLHYLTRMWQAIKGASKHARGAFMIYQEGAPAIRMIRDYFGPDTDEILINSAELYEQVHQFVEHVFADMVQRVTHCQQRELLFSPFARPDGRRFERHPTRKKVGAPGWVR